MNRDIIKILLKSSELLNKININNIKDNQIGGGRKLEVNYNKNKYIFEESKLDDNYYILYSKEEDNCVTVVISSNDSVAEIHGIGNFQSCIYEPNQNVGSTLLKITLKMLKKYKDKFNIKMIILSDNSLKKCKESDIKLSLMLTLLDGNTWYGKYGFRPIKIHNNKYIIDELNNNLYETNIKIINKLTISDINLIKFIKLTNNEKLVKACNKLILLSPTMLLKDFLKNLITNYNTNCELFASFYEQLFYKIMKFDPYRKLFGLIL